MDVDWVASDPETGRFSGMHATTASSELEDRLAALRARGEGYFQIAGSGREYPMLILGFRGAHAVLYRMDSAETMLIHVGDGSVPDDDDVTVLVMEEHNHIGGRYALALERAWGVVREFAAAGATGGEEEWLPL